MLCVWPTPLHPLSSALITSPRVSITAAKADEAATRLREVTGVAHAGAVELDLASYTSVIRGSVRVRETATQMSAPLRGLLLNAGVWPAEKRITTDGLEEGMQVCHVGHWLLTQELLPDLCAPGEEARVVTVSSSAHALAPEVDLSDVNWERRTFDAVTAYGESKLSNLLFCQELAQRLPLTADQRLTSLAVHPGVVTTGLFRELTPAGGPTPSLPAEAETALSALADTPPLKLLFKKPDEGCRTSCYALLAPGLPSGAYLSDCEVTDVAPAAKDARAREALWAWTEQWIAGRREAETAYDNEVTSEATELE